LHEIILRLLTLFVWRPHMTINMHALLEVKSFAICDYGRHAKVRVTSKVI
jgi:hypothetical protein